METISVGDEVYAIKVGVEAKDGSEWIGHPMESLQAQKMSYRAGKFFRVHFHILNPRTIKRTQEAFIVIDGKLAVDIYDRKGNKLGTLIAGAGEAVFVYRGGHGVRILEDTVAYECKAGAFSLVSEDKEFAEDVRTQ